MENYVLALGIRGLKAYGETWTRGYRGIKPDEVPQRNLLREKFYAEVQPFAEQMKKKDATVRERTEALYALAVQNQMQEKLEERRQQFEERGQEAFAKEYSQIYGIVMELLDKIVEVLGDDISLAPGQIRIRKKGSAGGHNGIKNIIANLGTDHFMRVKVGVGEKPKNWDLADYVLSPFTKDERPLVNLAIEHAAKAIEQMLNGDVDAAMNEYNRKSANPAE